MTKPNVGQSAPNGSSGRPPWLRIGPGLTIALVLAAFLGYRSLVDQKQARQSNQPPIVDRHPAYSGSEDKIGPTPEIGFITERRARLRLTDSQVSALERLQSKWLKFYGPKMAQANEAAAKMNEYLADARGNRRTPVAQIQDQAAPVMELSRQISSARRAYWVQATQLLTPAQRTALRKERENAWAAKRRAVSEGVRPLGRQ
jgi:hypothetical protein